MPSARLGLAVVAGVLLVGLGVAAFGLLGVATGASALEVGRAVAGRTIVSLIGLALLQYLVVRWAPPAPIWLWPVTSAGAFFVNPLTWTIGARSGGALLGAHVTGSTVLGLVVDLLLWLVVSGAVTVLALRASVSAPRSAAGLR